MVDSGVTAGVVKAFIVDNFMFGVDDNLKEDASFLESGIIDSTGILELIAFLEENFQIRVADEEMVPENFDSIQNIVRYLGRHRDLA